MNIKGSHLARDATPEDVLCHFSFQLIVLKLPKSCTAYLATFFFLLDP